MSLKVLVVSLSRSIPRKQWLSKPLFFVPQVYKMSDSSPRFTLYMSGTSYFAQKVMLALFEKKEPFTERLVNQREDDNFAPWFMKLNPLGKVPVLEDRGRVIPESEDIIDHLDRELKQAPRLVPDPSSPLGGEVARFRKLLNINAGVILHGLNYNPHLAPQGKPGKSKAELDAIVDGKIAKLEKLAVEHPELKEEYLAKIPGIRKRKGFADSKVCQKALDDLQQTLDQVESKLLESEGGRKNTLLLGSEFTAADISLAVLLRRLSILGLAPLYFTPNKRPALYRYWQNLQTRPCYIKLGDISTKYGVVA